MMRTRCCDNVGVTDYGLEYCRIFTLQLLGVTFSSKYT